MRVELAGVPFEVRCRFPENEAFLKDYETDKKPLFVIEPTDEDLKAAQTMYDRAAIMVGKSTRPYQGAFLENNAVLRLMTQRLVFQNVLLMHGSALCMDGEAYVFAAPSGTGKSTHARLWREAFGDRVWMINDDQPMLRIEDDGVTVYGTPWDGKHHLSRNASAPLKAMVWLRRDEVNHVRPMTKAEAFPVVAYQGYSPIKADFMSQTLRLETKLLDVVPFYELGCNMTTDAAVTAWEGMNKAGSRSYGDWSL